MNKREGRIGHLFQGRYKAILIDADDYLLELVRYIHLNPVRARLVSSPEDFPWSGHLAYLGNKTNNWLTIDWVLSQFAKNQGTARRRYKEFILDGLNEGYREEFHGESLDGRLLGNDRFVEDVLRQEGRSREKMLSLGEVVEVVCKSQKVNPKLLSLPGRSRDLSQLRTVIAYLVMEYGRETLSGLAVYVNRDVATLSNAVRGFKMRLRKDEVTREMVQSLLTELGIDKNNNKTTKA